MSKKKIPKDTSETNADSIDQMSSNDKSDNELPLIEETESTENQMEVHHHSNIHHGQKKWKEYFLEFLMIFLAVTMGFLAENYREHLIKKEKELNYIENLVRDLKTDKSGADEIIKYNEKMMTALDSFVAIRHLDFNLKENNKAFFERLIQTKMWAPGIFKPNEVTMNQIKSIGGFYIIRPQIADSISIFDMSNQNVKWSEKFNYTHGEETNRMLLELTDYPAIWKKTGGLNDELPQLMTDDKMKLLKFFNLSNDLMYTIQGYNYNLKNHLKMIDNLIKTLQDEYELHE